MSLGKKIAAFAGAGLIILMVFGAGIFVGVNQRPAIERVIELKNKQVGMPEGEYDFTPFWQTWNLLKDKYVAENEIDYQKMVWGAIRGMVAAVDDPYTVFLPPKEDEIFKSEVRGNFSGVGMEIGLRNGFIMVIAPLKGTPAYDAGVKAGDILSEIDEKPTERMTLEDAVSRIRGEKGTEVKLKIFRKGEAEARVFTIVRDTIQIPVIEIETKEDLLSAKDNDVKKHNQNIPEDVYIIRLFNFSERSPFAFQAASHDMILLGKKKLILDLRNNPGGFLEAAIDISSWFLPAGEVVVKEDLGDSERIHRSTGYNVFKDTPVVILINEGSASASEIVAGALRDHGKAMLVGTKTFGKGSVQELISVTDNTSLKVTVARWLTPNGVNISKEGIKPDVEIELIDDEEVKDEQLEKAIEILSKGISNL